MCMCLRTQLLNVFVLRESSSRQRWSIVTFNQFCQGMYRGATRCYAEDASSLFWFVKPCWGHGKWLGMDMGMNEPRRRQRHRHGLGCHPLSSIKPSKAGASILEHSSSVCSARCLLEHSVRFLLWVALCGINTLIAMAMIVYHDEALRGSKSLWQMFCGMKKAMVMAVFVLREGEGEGDDDEPIQCDVGTPGPPGSG